LALAAFVAELALAAMVIALAHAPFGGAAPQADLDRIGSAVQAAHPDAAVTYRGIRAFGAGVGETGTACTVVIAAAVFIGEAGAVGARLIDLTAARTRDDHRLALDTGHQVVVLTDHLTVHTREAGLDVVTRLVAEAAIRRVARARVRLGGSIPCRGVAILARARAGFVTTAAGCETTREQRAPHP
jgi:hypothetical protein